MEEIHWRQHSQLTVNHSIDVARQIRSVSSRFRTFTTWGPANNLKKKQSERRVRDGRTQRRWRAVIHPGRDGERDIIMNHANLTSSQFKAELVPSGSLDTVETPQTGPLSVEIKSNHLRLNRGRTQPMPNPNAIGPKTHPTLVMGFDQLEEIQWHTWSLVWCWLGNTGIELKRFGKDKKIIKSVKSLNQISVL